MKIALFCLVLSLFHVSTHATKQSYIVYMGAHSHGPNATSEDFDGVTDYHHNFLANFVGSFEEARDALFDSYTRRINGFAAILEEDVATKIARHPDVVSVFVNKRKQLHTTHSWDFMALEINGKPSEAWKATKFGEDSIIGNLDTGVWPESESFNDEGFGPVPLRWKGSCEHNNNSLRVHCNRKLIGAKHFDKGYKASGGNVNESMQSPRDFDGHGSHTLSTAGGNFVQASLNGIPLGTAKGGSPKARVASYKVCWDTGCYDSDIMAAFDMAIHDGVDVLSLSLGSYAADYFEDGIAIGAFHAVQKGIVVVCSAGNSGPTPGTVSNVAPWIFTVGASSMDRQYLSLIKLGNGHHFEGASLSKALPNDTLYPLISAADAKLANASSHDALLCMAGTLNKNKVKGKILACLRGETARVDKGYQAKLAGAVGMILCNDKSDGTDIEADMHVLPALHVDYRDGLAVFRYINSTTKPRAYFTAPKAAFIIKPAPLMAEFSSRGPNTITPEFLKPDITAPGVNVIAAYSPAADPPVSFMMDSGTSMSCPHISGVAGLLKTLHPTWTPAAIKSAIMTSARTRDNTKSSMEDWDHTKATPFAYGAGHVRPNRAADPGLIYDLTTTDYLHLLCALGYNSTQFETLYGGHFKCSNSSSNKNNILSVNYPSITVPELSGPITVRRTVTNVGSPGIYVARIRQPVGVTVTVKPKIIKFNKIGDKQKFEVYLAPNTKSGESQDYKFGELLWSDGNHRVRSPIVIAHS